MSNKKEEQLLNTVPPPAAVSRAPHTGTAGCVDSTTTARQAKPGMDNNTETCRPSNNLIVSGESSGGIKKNRSTWDGFSVASTVKHSNVTSRRRRYATVHAYVADQSGKVLDVLMENRNLMIQTVHVMVEGGCDLTDEEIGYLFDAAILAVEQENPPLQHTATQTSLRNSDDSTGNEAQRVPVLQVPGSVQASDQTVSQLTDPPTLGSI